MNLRSPSSPRSCVPHRCCSMLNAAPNRRLPVPWRSSTSTAPRRRRLPLYQASVRRRPTSIVQYRQKNGPFKKIEEVMNVRGIGEKSFLRIKTA